MFTDYSTLLDIAEKFGAKVYKNEAMKNHTTFRIGGECDVMVRINCESLLKELVSHCRENNIPYFILGKGSNVLVSSKGLRGAVFILGSDFSTVRIKDDCVECEAGASLSAVCSAALSASLSGLEFAYGIPGTVGGAVYMNAGAYGGEMKDVVVSCRYIDENNEIGTICAEDMELSYRHSVFSRRSYCITSVKMKLERGEKSEIKERMDTLMQKRKDKQPLEYPSAGSTFKRPEGDFAGRLIEASGLKGYTCGGAQVSEKHSGFVINKNNATFEDVLDVINAVKEKVYTDSGIRLECEVLIME